MESAFSTGIAGGLAFLVGEGLPFLVGRHRANLRRLTLVALAVGIAFALLVVVGVDVRTDGAIIIGFLVGVGSGLVALMDVTKRPAS